MSQNDPHRQRPRKTAMYVEDALIVISIGLLFWLAVLERHEGWAQIALVGVLIVMAVVLVRRFRRFNRGIRKAGRPGERPDR